MASKRILVVDDDSYVREATEEILRRKQYDVDTATDGKAALKLNSTTPITTSSYPTLKCRS